MSSLTVAVILGIIALNATYGGVARFRLWAEKKQLLDLPNERSSHIYPTPRGGGLILMAVNLLCGAILAALITSPPSWPAYLPYAAGALLVAAVSWVDDLGSLPSWVRLGIHFLAAILAVAFLGYWGAVELPLLGNVILGRWGAIITVLWIVGLTNAYNFMDGIDGIAGGQALVAGLGWALLGTVAGAPIVGGLGTLVSCSSLGFLLHNWYPAGIFMGDVGSAFLGYTLAVLPLLFSFSAGESAGAPVVGLLLVWPFVFDTGFTFLRRLWRRENVFATHRSHLYQRITSPRSGHGRVALMYSGLALAGGLLARVWSAPAARRSATGLLVLPLLCLGLWVYVVIQERRRAAEEGPGSAAMERP